MLIEVEYLAVTFWKEKSRKAFSQILRDLLYLLKRSAFTVFMPDFRQATTILKAPIERELHTITKALNQSIFK